MQCLRTGSLLLAVAVLSSAIVCLGEAGGVPTQALDASRPDTWERSVQEAEASLAGAVRELEGIALSSAAKPDDRRMAVRVLGMAGSSRSVEFLVRHIALEVPLFFMVHDADHILQRPCTYALMGLDDGRRRWEAVPLVLRLLLRPAACEERVLVDCSRLLRRVSGKNIARALVAAHLADCKDPVVKRNLETVKRLLN